MLIKFYQLLCALSSLIERWKNTLNQNGYGGTILMGFSKAFNTIKTESLKLIKSCLMNRLQRTKVNTSFLS